MIFSVKKSPNAHENDLSKHREALSDSNSPRHHFSRPLTSPRGTTGSFYRGGHLACRCPAGACVNSKASPPRRDIWIPNTKTFKIQYECSQTSQVTLCLLAHLPVLWQDHQNTLVSHCILRNHFNVSKHLEKATWLHQRCPTPFLAVIPSTAGPQVTSFSRGDQSAWRKHTASACPALKLTEKAGEAQEEHWAPPLVASSMEGVSSWLETIF